MADIVGKLLNRGKMSRRRWLAVSIRSSRFRHTGSSPT